MVIVEVESWFLKCGLFLVLIMWGWCCWLWLWLVLMLVVWVVVEGCFMVVFFVIDGGEVFISVMLMIV